MATYTITAQNTNYDTLTGGSTIASLDIYNINGGQLVIDTDTRYCANHTGASGSLDTVTISSTQGGELLVDGTRVRLIPFTGGSGNVPAIGTTISQGSVSAALLGVWSALNVAPTAAGSAMPSTGWIKVKGKSGGDFASGALSGLTASASGADVVGWIEVIGAETASITVPRLGRVRMRGAWFDAGTTTGSASSTYQLPASLANTHYAGVWIETGSNTSVYEFYPAAGSLVAANSVGPEAARGKVCWVGTQGLLRLGSDGTNTTGFLPPAGRRIRVPNILLLNTTRSASGAVANAAPNATLATRQKFATTAGGQIDFDLVTCNWYAIFDGAFSINITNSAINDTIRIWVAPAAPVFTNVGVGQSAALGNTALDLSSVTSGGVLSNCVFVNASIAAGRSVASFVTVSGFSFSNFTLMSLVNRTSITAVNFGSNQMDDCVFTNMTTIGGSITVGLSSRNRFINTVYIDRITGTTPTTQGTVCFGLSQNASDNLFDGLTFGGLSNVHPYNALINESSGGCARNKIRNIGSPSAPLSLGSANQTGTALLANNLVDFEAKRIYVENTRTGLISGFSGSVRWTIENVWGDFGDTLTLFNQNSRFKGIRATNVTTGQTGVYGSIWHDVFDSATTGRICIACNEKTATLGGYDWITQGSATGVAGFNSAGSVVMPNLNDEIIWETPWFIIGHTGFQNAAPALVGTNVSGGTAPVYGNFTFQFDVDKGNGFSGSWTDLTAANLAAVAGINAAIGVKLRIRARATTANASNALTNIAVLTTTDATALSYQYPLQVATVTVNGLVSGSRVKVTRNDTGGFLFTGLETGGSISFQTEYAGAITVEARKATSAPFYQPWVSVATIGTGVTITALQVLDT